MGALDHLGPVKDPTRDIASEVVSHFDLPHYPSPYNSPVIWGYNPDGAEHGTGRALDIMVRNDQATGDAVAEWLWNNRERFGLIHLIWRQRIRSTQVSPGVWRGMADRGSPTNNHQDHIHALFDGRSVGRGGGAQSVPFPKPKPKPEPQDRYYDPPVKRSVESIQKIVNVKVDGYYGPSTKAAVARYQKQRGVTADGLWGPATEAAYKASKRKPKPTTGKLLRRGSKGGAVKRLQRGLNKTFPAYSRLGVDGIFGPSTENTVREFQKRSGLTADGIVGPATRRELARYGVKP